MRSGAPAWLAAVSALVCLLAARVMWLAWSYYFGGGPRYPLESGAIALVVGGAIVVLLRSGDKAPAHANRDHLPVAWLPVFFVAALCVYGPALQLGLLSDDYSLRAMAQSRGLGVGSGWFFRPIPIAVWRLLLAFSNSAVPLHALNILLHGLNAFLVGALGVRLGMRRPAALVGATLFLTFPAAPEAVAWASGIQDVLLTTLALGAVIVAGGENQSGWRTAGACVLLVLGLGTKETAICIPALIAICWLTPLRMRHLREWRLYIALVAVAAAYSVFRAWIGLGKGYLVVPSRYFFKQLIAVAFGTLVTPWRSPMSPAARWLAFASVIALTLLLTHAFLAWRRTDVPFRRAARLALWVLAAVAPVFTYFFVNAQLEGSRYLYLAECGWALLAADLMRTAADRVRWRSLALACVAGTAVLSSTITLEREIAVWRRAADLRDRVLAEARASIINNRCAAARFTHVPDSVVGAYVFRNGFREALGSPRDQATSTTVGCDFTWNGDRFVPTGAKDR